MFLDEIFVSSPPADRQLPGCRIAFGANSPLAMETPNKRAQRLVEMGVYNFTRHCHWPLLGRVEDPDGTPVWIAGRRQVSGRGLFS